MSLDKQIRRLVCHLFGHDYRPYFGPKHLNVCVGCGKINAPNADLLDLIVRVNPIDTPLLRGTDAPEA